MASTYFQILPDESEENNYDPTPAIDINITDSNIINLLDPNDSIDLNVGDPVDEVDCQDNTCDYECDEEEEEVTPEKNDCKTIVSGQCIPIHDHDNIYYRKQEVNELLNGLGGNATLEEDVTSTVTEGNINSGDVIVKGTTFTEFVKTFLVKTYNPTYVEPSGNLILDTVIAEVGSIATVNATVIFNQGEIKGVMIANVWHPNNSQGPRSGIPLSYTIDGVAGPYNRVLSVPILLGQNFISATVNYGIGSQAIDSANNPFETRLPAGNLTLSNFIQGTYKIFYGISLTIPTTAGEIRALPNSHFIQTTEFTIDTGTQHIHFIIAVPPGKSLLSVIDLDASNQTITNDYKLINSNFPGQDAGGNLIPYKLYVKTNGIPYIKNHTHLINLI